MVTCAVAVILLLVSVWIVVPAPAAALVPLSVATTEVSAWLLLAALANTLMAARGRRWARTSLALSLAAALLAASPFARFPFAVREVEAGMRAALGDDYLTVIPSDVRRQMRPRTLSPLDLFTGIHIGSARITRGIVFSTSHDQPLTLDLYRPAHDGAGRPAIVQIHGGAWQRGDAGDDSASARYFAARGYVVFAINYRLAPRYRWPAPLEDVRAALDWIGVHGRDYGADPGKVALIGRSAGAQIALVAAYAPGLPPVRAVVSYYGSTNLARSYRDPPRPDPFDVRSLMRTYIGGTPDELPAAYAQASAVTYAGGRLPPTLLVYGTRDRIVSARVGVELHERLRASGNVSVLLQIPWADHAFDAIPSGTSAQLALYYTERFLARSLAGS